LATNAEKELAPRNSAGLGRPLRVPIFRNLLIADLVSDIGTFMQNVGAAWLMVSMRAGPGYVALTQTAASLPYFLLALPAGSAGDIFDRRKLILYTEAWMMGVALILAVLTISGSMSPWLLLALTFALIYQQLRNRSTGQHLSGPAIVLIQANALLVMSV
jgi:MFS family permease